MLSFFSNRVLTPRISSLPYLVERIPFRKFATKKVSHTFVLVAGRSDIHSPTISFMERCCRRLEALFDQFKTDGLRNTMKFYIFDFERGKLNEYIFQSNVDKIAMDRSTGQLISAVDASGTSVMLTDAEHFDTSYPVPFSTRDKSKQKELSMRHVYDTVSGIGITDPHTLRELRFIANEYIRGPNSVDLEETAYPEKNDLVLSLFKRPPPKTPRADKNMLATQPPSIRSSSGLDGRDPRAEEDYLIEAKHIKYFQAAFHPKKDAFGNEQDIRKQDPSIFIEEHADPQIKFGKPFQKESSLTELLNKVENHPAYSGARDTTVFKFYLSPAGTKNAGVSPAEMITPVQLEFLEQALLKLHLISKKFSNREEVAIPFKSLKELFGHIECGSYAHTMSRYAWVVVSSHFIRRWGFVENYLDIDSGKHFPTGRCPKKR